MAAFAFDYRGYFSNLGRHRTNRSGTHCDHRSDKKFPKFNLGEYQRKIGKFNKTANFRLCTQGRVGTGRPIWLSLLSLYCWTRFIRVYRADSRCCYGCDRLYPTGFFHGSFFTKTHHVVYSVQYSGRRDYSAYKPV